MPCEETLVTYPPQCPHWHPHVQGPRFAVPMVNVSQREGPVTVLWTAKMALMRRAVSPFVQAPAAGMVRPWVEPG